MELAIWQCYHIRQAHRVTIMPNRIGLHCLHRSILSIEYGVHMHRDPLLEVRSTRIHAQSINLRRIDVVSPTVSDNHRSRSCNERRVEDPKLCARASSCTHPVRKSENLSLELVLK